LILNTVSAGTETVHKESNGILEIWYSSCYRLNVLSWDSCTRNTARNKVIRVKKKVYMKVACFLKVKGSPE